MFSRTLGLAALVLAVGLAAVTDAEAAKRLGGGKSSGMQRENISAPSRQQTPPSQGNPQAAPGQPATAQQARPANQAAPAAAAPASNRSRWMAPLAGLAAGLGLAALASHFGFGEELANIMMLVLLAVVVMAVIGFVLRKRAGAQGGPALSGAAAGGGWQAPAGAQPQSMQRAGFDDAPQAPCSGSLIGSRIGSSLGGVPPAATALPAGFDAEGFARNAKSQFMALQQANDARDLARLREVLSPEMLEIVKADLAGEDPTPQTTEVYGLDAQVLQVDESGADYVVSVRFTGTIRHAAGAVPEDFDEVWHLSKPRHGSGGWVVAGIQQLA